MFPTINHINDLLPFIEGNPQFRVAEQPNGTTVVCYMLQDEDTFRGEHDAWYKECRGITFDTASGAVVSRTLHKFQNVGENEETQPHQIPWHDIVRVMDKRDGSMITPVLINGEIVCKTKKTFTSNEAIEATKFINADPEKAAWVRRCLDSGFTPTFEWTSPRFPIVLLYDRDELTLLQVRDNETGEYQMDADIWEMREDLCPFPVIENIIDQFMETNLNGESFVSWDKLQEMAKTRTGIEGVILQASDGRMWKVKTKWYCELHHSVTFTRYRDVARVVLADKSDDLKAAFALTGRDISPIVQIENEIFTKIYIAEKAAEFHAGEGQAKATGYTAKEMAMIHKDNPLFSQIMRLFRGGQVNWLEWYEKNYINDHSLEVIPTGGGMDDAPEVTNV